jgi:hypothetical protein
VEADPRNPKFDDIVTHLVAQDPSFGAATRTPLAWNRTARVVLVVAAGIAWAGLSVVMVVWGWRGALVAVPAVAVGVVIAVRHTRGAGTRASASSAARPPAGEDPLM